MSLVCQYEHNIWTINIKKKFEQGTATATKVFSKNIYKMKKRFAVRRPFDNM